MFKKTLFAAFAMLCFVGFSCSDDDKNNDTTGPVITLGKPANGDSFSRGGIIHIDLDLEDESGIKEYRVDIHSAEGHEGHGSKSLTDATGNGAWEYLAVYDDAKGQTDFHAHLHTEKIPDDAKLGEYHFGIQATDMLGNISRHYIDINIVE